VTGVNSVCVCVKYLGAEWKILLKLFLGKVVRWR